MKKVFLSIILIALGLLCSCTRKAETSLPSNETERKTETLFYDDGAFDEFKKSFSAEYDFDFDGKTEKISIICRDVTEDEWNSEIIYSVGASEYKVETAGGDINAVYVCDVDDKDGVKDLAVITTELSGDPVLRILKYGDALVPYEFSSDWDGELSAYPELGTGYVSEHYFNLNNDGTVTVKTQTDSAGMWLVMRDYMRDDSGVFQEIKRESYDILPEFMERMLENNAIDRDEVAMWRKGYIKAHCDYNHGEISIKEGEYFKVLKDNDENLIYIEKEDGTSGWIDIDYDIKDRNFLNPVFFVLAG